MILSCYSGSASYDKLQPILLKTFSAAIVPVVSEIFNKTIDEQEFPKSWKKAIIKPLHKRVENRHKQLQTSVNVLRTPNFLEVIV